jgi:hypothetical protein
MAPSYPVLRPIELRLSTSAANKESDNLYRRGRRSVGHNAIELFVKSGHAPLQDASLRQLGSAALRFEPLRPRMIATQMKPSRVYTGRQPDERPIAQCVAQRNARPL